MTHPGGQKPLAPQAASADISAFVEAARSVPAPSSGTRGRLIFALDATMSRQPTWDLAQNAAGADVRGGGAKSAGSTCNSSISAA